MHGARLPLLSEQLPVAVGLALDCARTRVQVQDVCQAGSCAYMLSELGAGLSSEHIILMAALRSITMRPSSLGGGRILRRTLSVCLSVCLSVRPVIERHVAPPSDLQ